MPGSTTGPKDLQRLFKIFRLIKLLSAPPYYTVATLAQRLDTSKKTIYNYLELLESIGLEPDVNRHHQYFLPLERRNNLPEGLGVDEARFLQEMLWQLPDTDPRRNQLLLWLNKQYAVGPIIENLTRYTPSEHRDRLTRAIEEKQRIRLINYRGANGKISSRYGEPIAFQKNFTYIYVYDLEIEDYRQFHLNRIGYVELTGEPIELEHTQAIPDIFGWTGNRWYYLKLELTTRAHQLLLEEYPESKPFIAPLRDSKFFTDLRVRGFPGIGRWCLGLCAEVQVMPDGDGEEFIKYLNERWGEGF